MTLGEAGRVEPLDSRRTDEAVSVLARAFDDNPATLAIFAGCTPEQRQLGLSRALAAFVDISWRHGTSEVLVRGGSCSRGRR